MYEKRKQGQHIQRSERDEIQILRTKKYSLKEIGDALDRPKSSIWYELQKRRKKQQHDARYAHHLSYVRRKYSRAVGRKIALDPILRKFVKDQLFDDQTPEAIAGRLRTIETNISHASAL